MTDKRVSDKRIKALLKHRWPADDAHDDVIVCLKKLLGLRAFLRKLLAIEKKIYEEELRAK